MQRFLGLHTDFFGFIASLVCAVHCTAVPVLFSLGLAGGTALTHNHIFDVILVLAGISFAGFSVFKDFQKSQQYNAIILASIGIGLLLLGLFGHGMIHNISSVCGGVLLASAHYVNWSSSHKKASLS